MPVIVAGLVPLVVFTTLAVGTGLLLVQWSPPLLWSDQFGTQQYNAVTSVSIGPSNLIATGFLNSSLAIPSEGDLFIRDYDLNGAQFWTRTFPTAPNSFSNPVVAAGTDGVYEFLVTNDTYSLLKYDLTGNNLWTKQFRGQHDQIGLGQGWISSNDQAVFVSGVVFGSITNQTSIADQTYAGPVSFVREYDNSGNVMWTSEISNSTFDIIGMYADSSGIYISVNDSRASVSLVKYDLNGNEMWNHAAPQYLITSFSGDPTGLYFSGYVNQPLAFLTKYDHNGNAVWTIHPDTPSVIGVTESLVAAGRSGVVLSMITAGGSEGWLAKYDENGNRLWRFQTALFHNTNQLGLPNTIALGSNGFYEGGSSSKDPNRAIVQEFSQDSSLEFFGVTPPWSFVFLGGLVAGSLASLFYFRRLRRRMRPPRVGLADRSMPVRD